MRPMRRVNYTTSNMDMGDAICIPHIPLIESPTPSRESPDYFFELK